ncbi:hypothetical protein GGS20DRAFT_588914 [Poronia punctata]|nr:hypothetical protein GGS20DRAFT_588914 [Poronia punctata]
MSSFPLDSKNGEPSSRRESGYITPTKSHPEGLWGGLYNDPRTSSSQSLTPSLPAYEEYERRILLVIYIHGFMGNRTSFQSFPAHVHEYLKQALRDSHVVHSKIYPKYKTYKTIDVARDNFSKWLEPLETPRTDIVLVGHSMGGLLAADVVLMASSQTSDNAPSVDRSRGYFKHRILGVVNLDAPLLGMHPGIVVSGISSLFRKNDAPRPAGSPAGLSPGAAESTSPFSLTPSVTSSLSEVPSSPSPFISPAVTNDPYFDPSFPQDVRTPERTWWGNVFHFVKKHSSEGLIDAATNHIMSHLEFGGTMFDLNRLKTRYEDIRRLEDVDGINQAASPNAPPQVRFIQYYTICNGYPKKQKPPKEPQYKQEAEATSSGAFTSSALSTPDIPVEHQDVKYQNETIQQDIAIRSLSNSERSSLELLVPEPISDEPASYTKDTPVQSQDTVGSIPAQDGPEHTEKGETGSDIRESTVPTKLTDAVAALYLDLPGIPELPPQPDAVNPEQFTDKDARKLAEKEAKRAQKFYAQAVKDREKAIRDREKIIEKRKKKQAQEAEKKAKEDKKKLKEKAPVDTSKHSSTTAEDVGMSVAQQPASAPPVYTESPGNIVGEDEMEKENKKRKERKFCNIAKVQGQTDPKWVSVFMKDVDEVAAHTGLFFTGDHYEGLVGDVGDTMVEWVHADMSKRAMMEFQ